MTKTNGISSALVVVAVAVAAAGFACAWAEPANADSGANSIENSFLDGSNASAAVAPLSSPLSGSVRVIDQFTKPMRLKRVESAPGPSPSLSSSPSSSSSSSPPAPQGSIADSGLQALFPSKDSFNPPPSLTGFAGTGAAGAGVAEASGAKAKTKHVYIWNMSLAGGYYDVTNTFQGVVPGNKLYLYGGFMADGHTPVPTGPVPMNEGGHIRWTPTMGEAPED